MNITRKVGWAGVPLALLVLAGCSIVNTNSSEVALQYGGGPFDSVKFVQCTQPGTHEARDVNDDEYYFPTGQRDFTFSSAPGSDSPPLTSVTKDGQQISVTGTVKFTLNTDCAPWKDATGKTWPGGKLQAFWELIGKKYGAVSDDPDADLPSGWDDMLRNYLGAAIDRADDTEALNFNWLDLYSSAAATSEWGKEVQGDIPSIVNQLTFGADIFSINVVLLQKPGVQPELQQGLADKQAAVLRQQAAAIDQQAATNFPGGLPGYQAYQEQQAVNKAITDGKVQVLPIPQGSSVIVGGK